MILYLVEITAGIALILYSFIPCLRGGRSAAAGIPRTKKTPAGSVCTGLLLALFLFLITYKADRIPMAYNLDEASAAYDALSLVRYGVDRYLYRNPVYFINFGGGQNALYTYLAALMIRIFGYSIRIIRMPAIILSFVSAVCLVTTIRNEYGDRAAVIAAGLFCCLPFSVMHSRWALESYLLFPMLIISCTALHHAVRTGKVRLFAVSGVLFGLTLYSYAISYAFLPLFLAPYLLYLLWVKKISLKHLFALGIPLFILALPLILLLAVNNGLIGEIRTPYLSVPKLPEYRGGEIGPRYIPGNLIPGKSNIFYRIFFNDRQLYNSIAKFGTLYYVSLPLILLGFIMFLKSAVRSFRQRAASPELMIIILFSAASITTLMLQDINVNRACEIYFPLICFLAAGLHAVCRRPSAGVIAAGVYLILSACFFRYYFTEYPALFGNMYGFASITDLKDALAFTESINTDGNMVYVIGKNQPYISVILALETDPYSFTEKKMTEGLTVTGFDNYRFMRHLHWDGIPEKPVYIFRDIADIPWRMDLTGLESRQFGTVKVYYSPLIYDPLPAE